MVVLLLALRSGVMALWELLMTHLIVVSVGLLIVIVLIVLVVSLEPVVVTLRIPLVLAHLRLLSPLIVSMLLLSAIPVFILLLLVVLVVNSILIAVELVLVLNTLILIIVHLKPIVALEILARVFEARSESLHVFRRVLLIEIIELEVIAALWNELLSPVHETGIHFKVFTLKVVV